ncbi:hypothetical protein BS47DRAFT_1343378, partial [Hydnum rufescens UP504]
TSVSITRSRSALDAPPNNSSYFLKRGDNYVAPSSRHSTHQASGTLGIPDDREWDLPGYLSAPDSRQLRHQYPQSTDHMPEQHPLVSSIGDIKLDAVLSLQNDYEAYIKVTLDCVSKIVPKLGGLEAMPDGRRSSSSRIEIKQGICTVPTSHLQRPSIVLYETDKPPSMWSCVVSSISGVGTFLFSS